LAIRKENMAGVDEMATVLVRMGKWPHCDTLYAGVCEVSPEGVASLLGVSELVARRALRRAGKFVPVSSSEHEEPAPMYIAVITPKAKARYEQASV
jgi:hypothetical protein